MLWGKWRAGNRPPQPFNTTEPERKSLAGTVSGTGPMKSTETNVKTKKFSIKVARPKIRGVIPPPGCAHKDRRNDYDRKAFKRPQSWD